MRKLIYFAFMVMLILMQNVRAADDVPSIHDVVVKKKQEASAKVTQKDKGPEHPPVLKQSELIAEVASFLPQKPIVYFETPGAGKFSKAYANSPISKFLTEESVKKFMSATKLGLSNLYLDLPEVYSSPDMVKMLIAASDMTKQFTGVPGRMAIAAYSSKNGGIVIVFLADIGANREAAHKVLQEKASVFVGKNPDFMLEKGARGKDYLDVIRSQSEGELVYGILKNYVVICSDSEFAAELSENMTKPKKALSSSDEYTNLLTKVNSKSPLRGFIDMPRLLAKARDARMGAAADMFDFACDVAGFGICYYDMRPEGDTVYEHVSSPIASAKSRLPGLPARLLDVGSATPADNKWLDSTARIVPYQTEFFVAASIKPVEFGKLVAELQPFGSSDYAMQVALAFPAALRKLMGANLASSLKDVLAGQVAVASLPAQKNVIPWLIIFPIKNEALLQQHVGKDAIKFEVKGLDCYRRGDPKDKKDVKAKLTGEMAQCWGVLSPKMFPKLKSSYLVIASAPSAYELVVDHATLGANLADQPDYKARIKSLGTGHNLVWYYNLPSVLGVSYRLVVADMIKEMFPPQFTSVSGLPAGTVLRRHLCGLAGGMAPLSDGKRARATISSPSGIIPAFGTLLMFKTPSWIRQRARNFQSSSRTNLGKMWLKLQAYATIHGRFPGDAKASDIRDVLKLFPADDTRARVFISPAAVEHIGKDAAKTRSYRYVGGLRTTDEPDMPIVYETASWHYDYLYKRSDRNERGGEQKVSGSYSRWRLVLTLDGSIRAYSEEDFKREILPRIKARK